MPYQGSELKARNLDRKASPEGRLAPDGARVLQRALTLWKLDTESPVKPIAPVSVLVDCDVTVIREKVGAARNRGPNSLCHGVTIRPGGSLSDQNSLTRSRPREV